MKNKNKIFLPLILLGLLSPPLFSEEKSDAPNWRPYDQTGIHVFEGPVQNAESYKGLSVQLGGHFAQQLQILDHTNGADAVLNTNNENTNQLYALAPGFNTATANLNIDVRLENEIRLNLILYLSSRHHTETWVKGGYLQIDGASFLNSQVLDQVMHFLSLRLGHMEINYGDAHFRRTDNANAMGNPFVGNLIIDAFTTEIGGEMYAKNIPGLIAMLGVTGGEIKGNVGNPDSRSPSIYGKLGYDSQVNDQFRLRLTGSTYFTDKSANNTLYGGDRSGSRYYSVMDDAISSTNPNDFSGRFNPGFRDNVLAFQFNPFIKFMGAEIFGSYERAEGSAANETEDRVWNQFAGELIYRFFKGENVYLGTRYNKAMGKLSGSGDEVSIDRVQVATGWFVTKNILFKVEYVNQSYNDFPSTSIFHEGNFDGYIMEGVVGF